MTNLPSLIERLEEATGPSRELDAKIEISRRGLLKGFLAGVVTIQTHGWINGPGLERIKAPRYTASIDAALTLVPEGQEWQCGWKARVLLSECSFAVINYSKNPSGDVTSAATPALALCIAALRARGELTATERGE